MAGTVVPATGLGWDTDIPDNAQPHGNDYNEHRETKKAIDIRIKKEHVAFDAAGVGGEHKAGSAKIFAGDYSSAAAGDALPTKRPDGTTDLDADDAGRLALDTDATHGGIIYRWTGSAWEAIGYVALKGAQTIAGVKTFSDSPIVPAPTTDMQASTKKYVDDQATAIITPQTGASNSVSLAVGNGASPITLKWGTTSGGARTVSFPAAFANGCYNVVATIASNASNAVSDQSIRIYDVAKTGFNFRIINDTTSNIYWQAIGY